MSFKELVDIFHVSAANSKLPCTVVIVLIIIRRVKQ